MEVVVVEEGFTGGRGGGGGGRTGGKRTKFVVHLIVQSVRMPFISPLNSADILTLARSWFWILPRPLAFILPDLNMFPPRNFAFGILMVLPRIVPRCRPPMSE